MVIVISGIGGLGGYFGGLLAKHFEHSDDVEIIFMARGENLHAIRKNGLQLLTSKGNFTAYPALATSDADEVGKADVLMCCTKRYDLSQNLMQCKSFINDDTIILPLLNGVDTREFISSLFPTNKVLDGCAYLVARLTEPGVIIETGNISKLFFGAGTNDDPQLHLLLDVFQKAGIEATLSDHIQQIIWEKFAFISPIATLTSYLDCNIGDIVADPEKKELLRLLLLELIAIAEMKNIFLPQNIYQVTIDRMAALPADSTSSMHSDFRKGKATELEALTGYIIHEAKANQLDVPNYTHMYNALQSR